MPKKKFLAQLLHITKIFGNLIGNKKQVFYDYKKFYSF